MAAVFVLLGLLSSTTPSPLLDLAGNSSLSNCTETEFACTNGSCIPLALRCNTEIDCDDASDEEACGLILCDESINFRCHNYKCINISLLCNDQDDCGDFSDELDCFVEDPEPLSCEESEWQCDDKKLCIPLHKVCDGESDCSDHSDEVAGCASKIECDGFSCSNGSCIPKEWICDGQNDCSDNSDEQNCTLQMTSPSPKNPLETTSETDINMINDSDKQSINEFSSTCSQHGELEQESQLHAIRMQIEEENLKAAKLRVKVAEIQVLIEETKLETAKLDS